MFKLLIKRIKYERNFFVILFIYMILLIFFVLAFIHPIFSIFIPFILYLRIRKFIGIQDLSFSKLTISALLSFGILFLLLFKFATYRQLTQYVSCSIGLVLSYLTFHTTEFETNKNGIQHRSSVLIPVLILVLFTFRTIFGLSGTYLLETLKIQKDINDLIISFNILSFGILFSYNIGYSVLVIKKGLSMLKTEITDN